MIQAAFKTRRGSDSFDSAVWTASFYMLNKKQGKEITRLATGICFICASMTEIPGYKINWLDWLKLSLVS